MAHRGGKGNRGVVGMRLVVERQDVLDHVHDLALVGGARAHHGLLDLHGGVLPHLQAGVGAGHDSHAARLRAVAMALLVFSPK